MLQDGIMEKVKNAFLLGNICLTTYSTKNRGEKIAATPKGEGRRYIAGAGQRKDVLHQTATA